MVCELVEEKTPKVVQALPEGGEGWTIHHALFARAGFTDPARTEARSHGATLIDLATLDRDLQGEAIH